VQIFERVHLVGSGMIGLSDRHDCHVYLIDGGREFALIDAGAGLAPEQILSNIALDGLDVSKLNTVLLTHTHLDHAGGCHWFQSELSCSVLASAVEARLLGEARDEDIGLDAAKRAGNYPHDAALHPCVADRIVADGETFQVGSVSVTAVAVAGHTKGSLCFVLDFDGSRALFSGDTLFWGGRVGLGNLPGSELGDFRRDLPRLRDLDLKQLFPGHYLWSICDADSHIEQALAALGLPYVLPLLPA
jgi:glyoxylase-like metal-dependent hydrolase (beta-lactamase superfamily II)